MSDDDAVEQVRQIRAREAQYAPAREAFYTEPARRQYVIWSIEHGAWWRPGRSGYTPRVTSAGCYDQTEAEAILARANFVRVNECAIPVECVIPVAELPVTPEEIAALQAEVRKLAYPGDPDQTS
jgi:hypothetical protein